MPGLAFLQQVMATLDRCGMVRRGDAVLIGVSGGPDSVALAEVMRRAAPRYGLTLALAHFHHGLRGREADGDERYVRALAERWQVPVHVGRVDVPGKRRPGQSIEEVARDARYEFFSALTATHGIRLVALGHHQDDQAETVLMQILRGSGVEGLGGMAPVQPRGSYAVIRPLLYHGKRDIARFVRASGLRPRRDSTNQDRDRWRNLMRHEVLPYLERRSPGAARRLAQLAEIAQADEAWMDQTLGSRSDRWWQPAGPGRWAIHLPVLRACPLAVQRRLIRAGILKARGSLRGVSFLQVEAVRSAYRDGAPRLIPLPRGVEARVRRGTLTIECRG